jgi:antitoxin VapB
VAFPDGVKDVEIVRTGDQLVITPVGRSWIELFERGPRVSEDFMEERIDPLPDEREPF